MLECREVMIELLHRDFGIDLGGGDVRMAENPTDAFNGHSIVQRQDGKTMSGTVHGDMLLESTFVHHAMDTFRHRPIFHERKDSLPLMMVSPDDFQRDVKQLYLERDLGLMSL